MILLTLVLLQAAASAPPAAPPPADTRRLAPAEMLDAEDRFRDGLPAADRARLDAALPRAPGGGIASCERGEGSRASCEAAAYLPALRRTGLMPRFLRTLNRPAAGS